MSHGVNPTGVSFKLFQVRKTLTMKVKNLKLIKEFVSEASFNDEETSFYFSKGSVRGLVVSQVVEIDEDDSEDEIY